MAVLNSNWPYRRWTLLIIAAGFALRLVWALAVPVQPVSDGAAYDQLAWNLATRGAYMWNNGDITAYWPVGTSFIYSLAFRIFGHSYTPILIINVAAGTMSIALVMSLARRWFSAGAALLAGGMMAFWPGQIEFTSVLASELLFNAVLLLALAVTWVAPIRSWTLKGLVAGVCLAAAAYIRPTALPMIGLIAVALWWAERRGWAVIACFSLAAAFAMALCIAPWTLRNERELGAPVLISSNGPANLWMGNNPQSTGEYMPLPSDVEGMSEVNRSKVLGERAKQFVLNQPVRTASLVLRKLLITHDRETIGVTWNAQSLGPDVGKMGLAVMKALSTAYWWLILILALAGAGLLLRRQGWRGLRQPALLAWVYFALVHAATVGADRYHFASIPFIAMLAGYALSWIASKIGHGGREACTS